MERDPVRDLLDRLMSVQAAIGGQVVGDTWATTLGLEDEDEASGLALQLCKGVVAAVEAMLAATEIEHPNRDAGLAGASMRLGVELGRAAESLLAPDVASLKSDLTPNQLIVEARQVWNHGPSGSNADSVAFLLGMDVHDAMDACKEVVADVKVGMPQKEWPEGALHRGICMGIAVERRRWQP